MEYINVKNKKSMFENSKSLKSLTNNIYKNYENEDENNNEIEINAFKNSIIGKIKEVINMYLNSNKLKQKKNNDDKIRIFGKNFVENNKDKCKIIFQNNQYKLKEYLEDLNNMFFGCNSLISLPDISDWNTLRVNNMSYLFSGCNSLLSLPNIYKWNT